MEPITIKRNEKGGFDVFQGDKYSDGLTYEEMIGVVIAMTQAEQYLDRFRFLDENRRRMETLQSVAIPR